MNFDTGLVVHTSKKNRPNLIFLHGWGGSWRSWYPIIDQLKSNYNLFVPDLPGFGQNSIDHPWCLDDYSQFIQRFIDHYHIKNPLVIGHSFGGAIASYFTIRHPNTTRKLVLVDAASIRHPNEPLKLIKISIAKTFKLLLSLPLLNTFSQPARQWYYRLIGLEKSDYESTFNNPLVRQTLNHILKEDLSSDLPQITIPTLIVWGGQDQATPLTDGQKIHRLIKNSQLVVYPQSSHFSYLENQANFIKKLIDFINDN